MQPVGNRPAATPTVARQPCVPVQTCMSRAWPAGGGATSRSISASGHLDGADGRAYDSTPYARASQGGRPAGNDESTQELAGSALGNVDESTDQGCTCRLCILGTKDAAGRTPCSLAGGDCMQIWKDARLVTTGPEHVAVDLRSDCMRRVGAIHVYCVLLARFPRPLPCPIIGFLSCDIYHGREDVGCCCWPVHERADRFHHFFFF